jgi:hypothetical protein
VSVPYAGGYLGLGNSFTSQNRAVAGPVGGWVELGRTTLGSAGDDLDVTSLADKRYLMILRDIVPTGGTAFEWVTLNNDGGSTYAIRNSADGAADGTSVSQTRMVQWANNTAVNRFSVQYLANLATKEKLGMFWQNDNSVAGAGTAPTRKESVYKWANTANAFSRIDCNNSGTGNYAIGSECVVLGWDPADVHTTNFWELLKTVSGDGTSPTLDTGTITAKKYLWIQIYSKPASTNNCVLRFNSDTGNNYANRFSREGGADITNGSQSGAQVSRAAVNPEFLNIFVINNSANEKLIINHTNSRGLTGAANAPQRLEGVHKWANVLAQITSIQYTEITPNNHSSASIMNVYGAN